MAPGGNEAAARRATDRWLLALGVAAALATLGACGKDDTSDSPPPACTVHGTSPAAGSYPPPEALPAGACTADARTCTMTIQERCPCGAEGPVDGYTCSCVAGAWSCKVTSQGATGCACDAVDASADAPSGE